MQDGRGWILNINCSVNYLNVFFSSSFRETSQPAVYNSAAHPIKGITMADLIEISLKSTDEIPFNSIMWKPSLMTTKYQVWYHVTLIFLHLIPGLLIDGLIKLSGNKPLYVNMHCIIDVHIYILWWCYISQLQVSHNFKWNNRMIMWSEGWRLDILFHIYL